MASGYTILGRDPSCSCPRESWGSPAPSRSSPGARCQLGVACLLHSPCWGLEWDFGVWQQGKGSSSAGSVGGCSWGPSAPRPPPWLPERGPQPAGVWRVHYREGGEVDGWVLMRRGGSPPPAAEALGQGVCRTDQLHFAVKGLANNVNSLCWGRVKSLRCKAALSSLPSPPGCSSEPGLKGRSGDSHGLG